MFCSMLSTFLLWQSFTFLVNLQYFSPQPATCIPVYFTNQLIHCEMCMISFHISIQLLIWIYPGCCMIQNGTLSVLDSTYFIPALHSGQLRRCHLRNWCFLTAFFFWSTTWTASFPHLNWQWGNGKKYCIQTNSWQLHPLPHTVHMQLVLKE